jgi:hypothetical protein
MSDLYNTTSERLWEKLEYHRNEIVIPFKFDTFPIDDLIEINPMIEKLIKQVQDVFNYEMSEFQCSWATIQFAKGGLEMMKEYNQKNNTNLKPRE